MTDDTERPPHWSDLGYIRPVLDDDGRPYRPHGVNGVNGKAADHAAVEPADVVAARLLAARIDFAPRMLDAWCERELPPEDFLIGSCLSTASRWLVFAPTGRGKSLFTWHLGAAVAAGSGMLNWSGTGKPRRVLIVDGEMPQGTVQKRMRGMARTWGRGLDVLTLSRLDFRVEDEFPPFDTLAGHAFLLAVIERFKPALVILDSIMSLAAGNTAETECWRATEPLVTRIAARRCGQVWITHRLRAGVQEEAAPRAGRKR